jgi:hypothetical protein
MEVKMCNNSCNECNRKIFSDEVSFVTISGVQTLVIDIPSQTFVNGQRGCLVITQSIPDTTTINAPVAISIGGVTTTVYPVTTCCGTDVVAAQLRTRRRYPFKVVTNATSGSFVILKNLSCAASNAVNIIPVGG